MSVIDEKWHAVYFYTTYLLVCMVTYLVMGLVLPENTFIKLPLFWLLLCAFIIIGYMLAVGSIFTYKNSVEFGRAKVMDKYIMDLGITQFGVVISTMVLLLGMTNASQVLFVVTCGYCILNTGYFAVNYKRYV